MSVPFPFSTLLRVLPTIVTRAEIPTDLESVSSVNAEAEVDPRSVGLARAAVDEIWQALTSWYQTGIHPAIQICVRRRGQVVLDRAIGYSHGGGPRDPPGGEKICATPATPFNVFSASKPMVAMAIHLLDQRNLLHLDDPVCAYIPEFAGKGKQWITIRHVLTHRAGLPTPPDGVLDLDLLIDPDNKEPIRILCDTESAHRAGRRLAYHAVTGGFLLGEIVRRVTGESIRTLVDKELREPMGWRWMNYGTSAADAHRVARHYFTGMPILPPLDLFLKQALGFDFRDVIDASNDHRFITGVLPAANLMATANELCEFYELLRCGGELHGHRVFDPLTVWRATSEQSYMEMDFILGLPVRYGMGFMLGGDWLSLYGTDTRHAFGHLGFTNIFSWADPVRELSCAIMTNGKPAFYPELYRAMSLMQTINRVLPKNPDVPARADFLTPWTD